MPDRKNASPQTQANHIAALLIPLAAERPANVVVTQISLDKEYTICGDGFNDATVTIQSEGSKYFVFRKDLFQLRKDLLQLKGDQRGHPPALFPPIKFSRCSN